MSLLPGGARSDRLLYQAALALDAEARLKVVRKMFEIRFGEEPPQRRSIEQLRGIEEVLSAGGLKSPGSARRRSAAGRTRGDEPHLAVLVSI